MPPIQLENIQISEISFVKAGANGLEFIAKDAQAAVLVTIRKTDAVKKAVYGLVYEPNTEDTQGELATAEEIEKAAWGAAKNNAVVKAQHDEDVPAFIAESYIAKANDPDGYPEGAWAVVIKVEDDDLWASIEKGDFKAFSMGGQAQKQPVEKSPEDEVQKEIIADSMIYATNLKDALIALQAIADAMGGAVEKLATVQSPAADPDSESPLAKSMATLTQKVGELAETVEKIAASTTDGRATSATPGNGGTTIDPSGY